MKSKYIKGQLLIELIIAIALTSVLLPAFITGFVASREGKNQTDQRLEASNFLKESEEAVRVVRENGWNNLSEGIYHPEILGSTWVLVTNPENINGFTRQIEIFSVNRNNLTGDITESGGILDPSTKKIVSTVSWGAPIASEVESTIFLQRHLGNTQWLQTTRNDFNDGTFINTTISGGGASGQVELDTTGGTISLIDDYDNPGDYSFDPNKIEVVGSFAQLTAQGTIVNGSTTNSGFDTDASDWTFNSWGQNISQGGTYQSTGGNPGGFVGTILPTARNRRSGGYWYQSFTTTVNNPTVTLNLDWVINSYTTTPDSFRVYAFVDTNSAEPIASQAVWDSGEITSTSSWNSTPTLDVSSKVITPGTYYLKIAVFVDYPNSNIGPFNVGFDNVTLTWSGISGSSYPSDSPSIHQLNSLNAPSVTSWNNFNETANKNGGDIFYQLSDDNGSSWQYFNGSSWITATSPTDSNDQPTVNTNISSFSTSNNQISVKAFLVGDSTQQVRLDQIEILYSGSAIGSFTSSTFDAAQTVSFNNLVFTANNTPNTTTQLKIAIKDNLGNPWTFLGPDGTQNSYFTQNSPIHLSQINGRYLQFLIEFTSLSNDVPSVEDVSINYSP